MPVSDEIRERKARQGMFFISLGVGATSVVVLMLLFIVGYMVYRGSARLFFSPTYVLYHADGSVSTTRINESIEFDAVDELGRSEVQSPLQAAKQFRSLKVHEMTYGSAPIPDGTVVEVWKDDLEEVVDPWEADNPDAPKIKKLVPKKKEEIKNAASMAYDLEKGAYSVVLKDGTRREFDKAATLHFRQGAELLNRKTLVTRYLQNNPDEDARRRAAAAELIASSARENAHAVDPRWKVWLKAPVEKTSGGVTWLLEERTREFSAVTAFTIVDRWNWFQFFWDFPRSGNTEGGVLPCIYGTVMMTLIMTVLVAPFGVATAVYLMEYAHDNWFTRLIRIAVANLAGVPSIVFGLFGLGFFVMAVGGGIDRMLYTAEMVETRDGVRFTGRILEKTADHISIQLKDGSEKKVPMAEVKASGQVVDKVFGTPCILWAALTMALLTLPVMIVASEEALRTVPRELREGALALGATKFATITTVVIPSALPGILTGVILAVARASGEVAPLLLTGVVAHKDQLPTNVLEKFMNLAYHIYDLSVKSQPNKIEEAQALAFSAALVLVLVVLAMNLLAILLRARLGSGRRG
ncbi:MAG TPA: ABC transporter permease subunit [Planctomycetota bacterium]|nr:ABC transporter permease subunit [Planctomycetota bacterium]